MSMNWGSLWQRSRPWLKAGWLITAGLMAVYIGAIQPLERARGISQQRETGLGAVGWEPVSLWRQSSPAALFSATLGRNEIPKSTVAPMKVALLPESSEDRKLVRTSSLDLVVKSPAEAAEKIRQLAERMGGFLVSSQVSGAQDAASASVAIRVPAARLEEARAEIRKLGIRVDSDRVEAQDVTKDYVDREARLRNLRAQEQQYLGILKRATTVKDTLEVSDTLNEVRGQIEQQQAEFEALSKQVETVVITVTLRAETDAQVFGLYWRPLYQLKLAAREGLEGIADYATSMTAFLFYLPTILLWLITILLGAALGWRILRWGARVFFAFPKRGASPGPAEVPARGL
jgi:hypothetical protein